jgi:hypothetical protein
MKKKLFILVLGLLALSFSDALAQKKLANSIKYKGHFYRYEAEQKPEDSRQWTLTVKSVEKKGDREQSHIVYNTIVYVGKHDNLVTEARVFGANMQSYIWHINLKNYFKANFDWANAAIDYQSVGEEMTELDYHATVDEAEVLHDFDKKKLKEENAVEIIAEQFIKRYFKLFEYIEEYESHDHKPYKATFNANGADYKIEVSKDPFKKGKYHLLIRNDKKGLVFNSLLTVEDQRYYSGNLNIFIYHAKARDYNWSTYAGDYIKSNFNMKENTIVYTKKGAVIPAGDAGVLHDNKFNPDALSIEKSIDIAVHYFIKRYNATW